MKHFGVSGTIDLQYRPLDYSYIEFNTQDNMNYLEGIIATTLQDF